MGVFIRTLLATSTLLGVLVLAMVLLAPGKIELKSVIVQGSDLDTVKMAVQ